MGGCAFLCKENANHKRGEIEVENSVENTKPSIMDKDYGHILSLKFTLKQIALIQKMQIYIKYYLKKKKILVGKKKQTEKRVIYNKQLNVQNSNRLMNPVCENGEGLEGILMRSMRPELKDSGIFVNDPFLKRHHTTSTKQVKCEDKTPTDPRDIPNDNKRRKFPKIFEEESSYEGDWKNGKRDGFGELRWKDESVYTGQFNEDKVNGLGKLVHGDGDFYYGYWNDFRAHGIGKYSTIKGASYEGEWFEDHQQGFGRETWPAGSSYEGEYMDGNKDGIGILSLEDKAGYKGNFVNGNILGIGTFYFSDYRRYEGEWKNNKMHGYGIITWPDGKYFEGEFVEDKKEGFGVFDSNKKIYMGFWRNSKLEGEVILLDNGDLRKQLWINNRKVKTLPRDYYICFEKYAESILHSLWKT